ncbi:MAG: helix-turn-helix domain-containing protein [Butyrivibrio sp.]|nr:helix-turn-helix domain-containing protein [Butyrivibrio sp.]
MLTKRLNELFETLNATSAEIANKAGFDRTNISRIKSGKRVPHPDSVTADKLINGIFLFADTKNKHEKLCKVIGADQASSTEEIKEAMKNWLYEGYDPSLPAGSNGTSGRRRSSDKSSSHQFSERLGSAMLLAELSNVRLSKLIHADASLISRYRNGVRTPVAKSELSSKMCSVLFDHIIRNGKETELCDLMRIQVSDLEEEVFSLWLHGKDEQEDNVQAAENILGIFDTLTAENAVKLPAVADILIEDDPSTTVYYGIEGLRSAVLRFLSTAVREGVPEMYLYSDMNQSWLTLDTEFRLKWAALMFAAVKNGTHINIIHNLDRSLDEMADAIKSWLPLYMSGMIESYYCRKQRNPRFSHTMFLIPGVACIRAFQVSSADSDAIHHYYTDARSIAIFQKEYEALLKSSSPLIHPLPKYSFPIVSDIIIIQNALSFATMPENLVKSLGDRNLYESWQVSNALLLKQLETNTVHECIPLADPKTLRNGAVPIAPSFSDALHFYTPMQYAMHIRNIISLSAKYESYRFCPIPETPFSNIDLLISDNVTKITPASGQGLSFVLKHPLMCVAFQAYARTIMEKNTIDRNSIKKMLEAFT